jgi:Protein of unknown function (DUF2563)
MIIDNDLLRMGADFSASAGEIVRRGANHFASAPMPSGVFGDFDAAHKFQGALQRHHEAQVAAMHTSRQGLEILAQKSKSGAAMFATEDEASQQNLDSAVRTIG